MDVKFSIGYNHDLRLFKIIEAMKEHIESVYFPIPFSYSGSGRALKQGEDYASEVLKIIKKCKEIGVKSLMLLNATCDKELNIDKIVEYVKGLDGLSGVIVTNPVFIPLLKGLGLEVHSSVNCYVKNLEHARDLKEMGVDVLTIDRDINRDLELIKKIRKEVKVKILLNEGCLRNCAFRKVHFNLISHNIDTVEFDKRSCITLLRKHPEKFFFIPFVRPEDLKYYDVDCFKLATRTMDSIKIGLVLDAYVNQKFEGDLLFLLSGKGIFEYFNSVDNKVLSENDFFNRIIGEGSLEFAKEMVEKACDVVKF